MIASNISRRRGRSRVLEVMAVTTGLVLHARFRLATREEHGPSCALNVDREFVSFACSTARPFRELPETITICNKIYFGELETSCAWVIDRDEML